MRLQQHQRAHKKNKKQIVNLFMQHYLLFECETQVQSYINSIQTHHILYIKEEFKMYSVKVMHHRQLKKNKRFFLDTFSFLSGPYINADVIEYTEIPLFVCHSVLLNSVLFIRLTFTGKRKKNVRIVTGSSASF